MTEENLNSLSLDQLYTLMVKAIDEYLMLRRNNADDKELQPRRDELYSIQTMISKKEAENPAW